MAQYRKDTHQYLPDGKTIFEVVMLADQDGNAIPSPGNPTGTAVDAFGRARVSQPFTLLDSFHRFADNGKINTANTAGGTYAWNANTASIDCTVSTLSGASVYRESKKVLAYQPGKSLLILTTFVMNPAQNNLRQRIGIFGVNNGFFLENSDDVYFVKRSSITGSAVDTKVSYSNWNVDAMDGNGPSGIVLDLTKPQILWIDVEWLGVGSVRLGFVINGQFIHCHTFHHANIGPLGAYMQTACLPMRMEIENTGTTASSSTYKQICTTAISEGGYELSGKRRIASTSVLAANTVQCVSAGTFYPVVSIRLHANTLDSIVVPKQITVLPVNQANYQWKIVNNPTINGAVWANAASDSTVQYNTNTSATMTGGDVLDTGFITSTVQAGGSVNLNGDGMFKYQLERNSFTNTATIFTLAVACGTATSNVAGAVAWEEIT